MLHDHEGFWQIWEHDNHTLNVRGPVLIGAGCIVTCINWIVRTPSLITLFLVNYWFLSRNRLAGIKVPPGDTPIFAQFSRSWYELLDGEEIPPGGAALSGFVLLCFVLKSLCMCWLFGKIVNDEAWIHVRNFKKSDWNPIPKSKGWWTLIIKIWEGNFNEAHAIWSVVVLLAIGKYSGIGPWLLTGTEIGGSIWF